MGGVSPGLHDEDCFSRSGLVPPETKAPPSQDQLRFIKLTVSPLTPLISDTVHPVHVTPGSFAPSSQKRGVFNGH